MQVTDRLVTRVDRDPKPFDVLANKNIVFIARDAAVSFAYTGSAYIDHLPTDDWIAQQLSGVDVSEKFAVRTGQLAQFLDIGHSMDLLARELARSEVARQEGSFELIAIGWQWKNTRHKLEGRYQPAPMAWGISKATGQQFEAVERIQRHWHRKHHIFSWASPRSNFSHDENVLLFKEFETRVSTLENKSTEAVVNQLEQASVNSIRSVSAANSYVGPNCMSVFLAPPHQQAFIRVKFMPDTSHSARVIGQGFVSPAFPAIYSPWLIGGGLMHRPSVLIGDGWSFQMGAFTVVVSGPSSASHISGMSSQPRPPRPARSWGPIQISL